MRFDNEQIDKLHEIFGFESDINNDGRVVYLLSEEINQRLGLFSPADLVFNNKMEIIYLAAPSENQLIEDYLDQILSLYIGLV